MHDLLIKALRYTLSKSHVIAVVIGRRDNFGLNWIFDCHLKTALNISGAMNYPFQKHPRLCELVKTSLIIAAPSTFFL